MSVFRRILLKISRRRRLEAELEAELAFHRDQARAHNNKIGLGHVARIQEEARDIWRFTLIEDFGRDLSYAVRSLFRTPAFAVTAIVDFGVGHWSEHCRLHTRLPYDAGRTAGAGAAGIVGSGASFWWLKRLAS
jgi:hypothetical protein